MEHPFERLALELLVAMEELSEEQDDPDQWLHFMGWIAERIGDLTPSQQSDLRAAANDLATEAELAGDQARAAQFRRLAE